MSGIVSHVEILTGESPSTSSTPRHCCRVNIKSFTVTISPHITRLVIEHKLSYNSVIYRLHGCQRYIPTLLVNATVSFASAFNVTSGVNGQTGVRINFPLWPSHKQRHESPFNVGYCLLHRFFLLCFPGQYILYRAIIQLYFSTYSIKIKKAFFHFLLDKNF